MWGTRKNKETVVANVRNAANLSSEIDNLTESFTTLIEKLRTKAKEAKTLREAKEESIKAMQVECEDLSGVESRADNLADKIANIFN